jgi:4'-phosphopantetheinyl transferase
METDGQLWTACGDSCPVLGDDEVHVWRVCVSRTAGTAAALAPTLPAEEAARAARFHFEKDRLTYVVGRGRLRALLGAYLNRPAAELRFTTNEHGKPALAADPSAGDLQFNVSHSGDWVVYAVTRGRAVGVDVEGERPLTSLEGIGRRFFSPREVAALFGLPESERRAAFFRCWSRKEAYIKAVGRGLAIPLDEFDVSLAPGEPARLLEARGAAAVPGPWGLRPLDVADGYAAAVAVHGTGWRLACWDSPSHAS